MSEVNETHVPDTPIHTNRGVFRSIGVDWLSWSKLGVVENFHDLLREIACKFKTTREKAYANRGFRGVDLAGHGVLAWRGSQVLVHFPALALQYIRHRLDISDIENCRWFLNRGFKSTRIDIVVDSADKRFSPLIGLKYRENGNTRSEASRWKPIYGDEDEGKIKTGVGMTLRIGSPKSERWMRIYDKKTELMKHSGEIPLDHEGNELDHLTRLEMQNRRKVAHEVALAVAVCEYPIIPKIIGGYVSFLSNRDNRQRRRKRIAKWWADIIGEEKFFIQGLHTVSTPDRALKWIKTQVVPTLKAIKVYLPDEYKSLKSDLVDDYELRESRANIWAAHAQGKAKAKAARESIERFERDERVIADFVKFQKDYRERNGEAAHTIPIFAEEKNMCWPVYGTNANGEPVVVAIVDPVTGEEFDLTSEAC